MKQIQIQAKLIKENKELRLMLVVAIIGILVLGALGYIFGQQKLKVESQLQECEGDLTIEEMTFNCKNITEKGTYAFLLHEGKMNTFYPSRHEAVCEVLSP